MMTQRHPSKPIAIHSWDWREQPCWDTITDLIENINHQGDLSIVEVETGSDEHAIVIGCKPLLQEDAIRHYLNREHYEEGRTDEVDWDSALQHLEIMRRMYFDLGAGANESLNEAQLLLRRVEQGERSIDLYDEIMGLS